MNSFLPFDLSSLIFWMSSFLISGVSGESVDVFIFIEFYIENPVRKKCYPDQMSAASKLGLHYCIMYFHNSPKGV